MKNVEKYVLCYVCYQRFSLSEIEAHYYQEKTRVLDMEKSYWEKAIKKISEEDSTQ